MFSKYKKKNDFCNYATWLIISFYKESRRNVAVSIS